MDMATNHEGRDDNGRIRDMQGEMAQLRMLLLRLIGLIDQREATLERLEERVYLTEQLIENTGCRATELHDARTELCTLVRAELTLRRRITGMVLSVGARLDAIQDGLRTRPDDAAARVNGVEA
jgi:hypothetical protein